jgi:anthranilate/para-aminobenzoate synthase component I
MFVQELPAETSPEAVARVLCNRPGLAWLDAEGSSASEGRYSFLGSDPVETRLSVASDPSPFALLDELCGAATDASRSAPQTHASGPPANIVPRWIGYISYEAKSERGSRARASHPTAPPAVFFARYDALIAIDHLEGRAFVVAESALAGQHLRARLNAPPRSPEARIGRVVAADPAQHAAAIARALEHIAAGDIYQVNLARVLRASYAGDALRLGLAMREQSPVPLGFFFDDGQRAIIARTMERFLRWQRAERTLLTRPIKGTLARSGQDALEAHALAGDPKERAEHSMIIDLMRNDLSRVAELGTVQVPEIMAVERYAKLSHLVSTVICTTRHEVGARAILEATFPPGSVTGAPKERAMQIIDALEDVPRGVYTGAVGYLDQSGGLSLAVAIRTATIEAGEVRYFAGGGIVEASIIERELDETVLKAQVFLDAAEALRSTTDERSAKTEAETNVALSQAPLLR